MRKALLYSGVLFLSTLPFTSRSQFTQDWVRKFVGLGNDNAAAIAPDNSGNVYIVGNNNWGIRDGGHLPGQVQFFGSADRWWFCTTVHTTIMIKLLL